MAIFLLETEIELNDMKTFKIYERKIRQTKLMHEEI